MEIISISRYQKAGPLIEKILELSGGKLAREDARRLVDRIWQFQEQTHDQFYIHDLLQLAKDLGLSSNEWNAIWKAVAIERKVGTENWAKIFDIDRQDSSEDEIEEGIGRFGWDVSNPVPVNDISANTVYLSRLRTMDGDPLAWRRKGSYSAKNIKGLIDAYEIWNAWTGAKLSDLYISPYNRYISRKAPDGLAIIGPGENTLDHCVDYARIDTDNSELASIIRQYFGLLLPISGGGGQNIQSPITIHVRNHNRATAIEQTILACIHKLGKKEWFLEKVQLIPYEGRTIRKLSVVLADDPSHYHNFYFDASFYE